MAKSDTNPPSSIQTSRPTTPASQLTNSLYRANATIDDFTTTLAKISRAPTPDDADLLHCCCEVGQALLEKHEAYVRRHGSDVQLDGESIYSRPGTPTVRIPLQDSQPETRTAQLVKDNFVLEKKLTTALLNAEVAESSRNALIQELDEAKEAASRLAVTQVKSTGWEVRLSTAVQEKDDLRQELDSERQRSKAAETHILALKDRCSKQHSEISRLYDDLEQQKQSRTGLSEEILRDARARLQMFQQQQLGHTVISDNPEVTQVMESLVADNEALKRDIAELQNLLTEAREDVRMLREEVEETRAASGGSRKLSSASRFGHGHTFSWASSFGQAPLSPDPRSESHSTQPYEPLTPNTDVRPLSPAESRATSERRSPPLASPRPNYPPSHISLDADDKSTRTGTPETAELKSQKRTLLLLTQTKGVQTEDINWSNLLGPVFRAQTDDGTSATPPGDGRSESSSLADTHSHASTIAALVDRANGLFARMTQADARTLMNRLKRQRLAGDISHLSHATVSAILNEASGLRSHFRGVLEDERSVSTCSRRDLRALLALLREMFAELGQMRVALNDIILDPSLAPKMSETAMDPSKAEDGARARASARGTTTASGWMAPFSKLFGGASAAPTESKPVDNHQGTIRPAAGPPAANANTWQKLPKFIPKSGPALAASTTTVNVEFSNAGVGRSVSSNLTTVTDAEEQAVRSTTPTPGTLSSRAVMGIFAGAPQVQGIDPWVILPKPQRKLRNAPSAMNMRTATLTRSAGRWAGSRLSRNVDAVIDSESAVHNSDDEDDEINVAETLLERTLRPRGLSDSSIRSTFINDEDKSNVVPGDPANPIVPSPPRPQRVSIRGGSALRQSAFPATGRPSVLQAFSKAFTIPALSAPASETTRSSTPPVPSILSDGAPSRAISPRRMPLLPSLAQWAATQAGLDMDATEDFVGSVRERDEDPNYGHRPWQRDQQGRDV
ncbi:hypothetical protein EW145_g5054 [Phellinidium pouzarii]|uniref:Uncharacterized protein n=1 Tax=Phellinidium pouzarii TaxID=167371 RepID=A0A4S4L391_9AGAM|nr:hypothetical protein EW145_g5054 [Phellinidium pouzarii]